MISHSAYADFEAASEKYDNGDCDPTEDCVEYTEFHISKGNAVKYCKQIVKTKKDQLQWHPRDRRAWRNEAHETFVYEEEMQWQEL